MDYLDYEVQRLVARLRELKRLDFDLVTHGARGHRYALIPWQSERIARLEDGIGFTLSQECRRWLQTVGSGAGPGYGVDLEPYYPHKPDDTSARLPLWRTVDDVEALTPEFIARVYSSPRDWTDGGDGYLFALRSWRGMIRVAEHGCGAESLLIGIGPQAGRIIDDWVLAFKVPDDAVSVFGPPPDRLPGQPRNFSADRLPTFLEWIAAWIERSIDDLPNRRELRRRTNEAQARINPPPAKAKN